MRDYGADELIRNIFGNPRDDQPVGLVDPTGQDEIAKALELTIRAPLVATAE